MLGEIPCVRFFGNTKNTDGSAKMYKLLGGKGANLAEMALLNIPVPPGFTISTDVCVYYMRHGEYPPGAKIQIMSAFHKLETLMKQQFGSERNPLLVSVRSGARQSMPGMMETVLNVGLTDLTAKGLIYQTSDQRFTYDSYRRLIMMYADVVMDKPMKSKKNQTFNIRQLFEAELTHYKAHHNITSDALLNKNDLLMLCKKYKKIIQENFNQEFPNDVFQQLWNSIAAVFKSSPFSMCLYIFSPTIIASSTTIPKTKIKVNNDNKLIEISK